MGRNGAGREMAREMARGVAPAAVIGEPAADLMGAAESEGRAWPAGPFVVTGHPRGRTMAAMRCRCGGDVLADGFPSEGGVVEWCGCGDVLDDAVTAFDCVWLSALAAAYPAAVAAARVGHSTTGA